MERSAGSRAGVAGNVVSGRVLAGDSRNGVPDLTVVVSISDDDGPSAQESGVRLGSVTTDREGAFALEWNPADAPARPTLRVEASDGRTVLASETIEGAARLETILLRVDPTALVEGKPDEVAETQRSIENRRLRAEAQALRRADARERLAGRVEKRRQRRVDKRGEFRDFVRTLSREREPRQNKRFVEDGASVAEANRTAIREGLDSRVAGAERVGVAMFAEDEAKTFALKGEIPAEEVNARLRPRGDRGGAVRVRTDPLAGICQEYARTDDPCVAILKGEPDAAPVNGAPPADDTSHDHAPDGEATPPADPDPDAPPAGPDPDAPAADKLPLLVANLIDGVTPPEVAPTFLVAGRAGVEDVEKGVDGFELRTGPADAPAHHEFHHLQIAFEHVWHELFDSSVSDVGTELFSELVELGVDPQSFGAADFQEWLNQVGNAAADDPLELVHPPPVVMREFDVTAEQWTLLTTIGGNPAPDAELETIAEELQTTRAARDTQLNLLTEMMANTALSKLFPPEMVLRWREAIRARFAPALRDAQERGDRIVRYADRRLDAPEDFEQFHTMLRQLETAIREPYRFSVYAADRNERSVNFGLVTTYVQRWQPTSYQVGKLVKTVTLAPKEVRRFSKRVAVKKSRAEKEVQSNQRSRRSESSETARSEAEIVQKAMNKTNFQMSAEGGVSVGIASAKGSTAMGQDAATESQEVKKEFREAVFKAAEEFRAERSTEVTVNTQEDLSLEESGEISNPNDELPVTYLFYELQRRYDVAEMIRRLTPVILVAQEFPTPSEIDDDWLVAHDWILRRVILDDSFLPALNYVASGIVGDEYSLKEQYQNLQQHRRLVENIETDVVAIKAEVGRRYEALQRSIARRADALDAEESEGFLEEGIEGLFGSTDQSPEALRVREDAARDAAERAAKEEKELLNRLERETTALAAATETYTKDLRDHLNRKAQIARLRIHVKQNAMYYMQAVWSHEPPDQRFFRLHDVRVPKLDGHMTYSIQPDPDAIPMPPDWKKPQKLVAKAHVSEDLEFVTLEEVADLDNLLGFKGNYMMFPLREGNVLTDFMSIPYIDPVSGLRDPDPRGNWTQADFIKYVCCLRDHLTPDEFNRLRPGLFEAYQELAADAGTDGEVIVTPTDSLFIEALPGAHPILEDYKLIHRAVDVKRAQAEARAAELENLRFAGRLLTSEYEDPTIEKKVIIEGGDPDVVQPTDDP